MAYVGPSNIIVKPYQRAAATLQVQDANGVTTPSTSLRGFPLSPEDDLVAVSRDY